MQTSKSRDARPTRASSDTSSIAARTNAPVQAKAGLRGLDFESADAALHPPTEGTLERGFDVPAPSGAGNALPDGVRDSMQGSFGADFSGVRVHHGPSAASMGGVRAATQGSDITFASGEYAPESQGGRELIGHELTHVVQQAAGRVEPTAQNKGGAANTDPGLEAEADQMGALAAAGLPAPVAGVSSLRGEHVGGEVKQFNIFATIRDTVKDKHKRFKDKKKAKKDAKATATTDNDAAILAARDDLATGAQSIATLAETDLGQKLASFVEGKLSGDDKLVKDLKAHGAQKARDEIGTGDSAKDDASAVAESIVEKADAHGRAISAKSAELGQGKAGEVSADLVTAAQGGFDSTHGAGDKDELIVKAKAKAATKAKATAREKAPKLKEQLAETLETDRAAIKGGLETATEARVESKARKELTKRTAADAEVLAAVSAATPPGTLLLTDAVKKLLRDKLAVDGVGATRSTALKDFRKRMNEIGRTKAQEDANALTAPPGGTDKSQEQQEDARKRTKEGADASTKRALEALVDEGAAHAMTEATALETLESEASKAAWASIRDGGDGLKAAKKGVLAAVPTVQAAVHAKAKIWRDALVKTKEQARLDEAADKVKAQVASDEVGKDAADASESKEGDVDWVVGKVVPPAEKSVDAQVYKHLKSAIGAMGAGWWRGDEVKAFRGKMKKAGRKQAYQDVDQELATPTLQETQGAGKATKAYMEVAGKDVAYDKAKGSVNEQMKEFAKDGAAEVLRKVETTKELSKVARKAAFKAFRNDKAKRVARAEGQAEVNAAIPVEVGKAMAEAETWKRDLFANETYDKTDTSGATPTMSTVDTKSKVAEHVKDDEVGKRSVKQAIKANTTAEGMAALGRIADVAAPNRGDSAKLEVEMRIPVPNSPAFVKLHVVAEAERGVTTRKNGAPPGSVDAKSLKVGAQFNVGGGVDLWGLRLDGTIGFFVRAQAMDTQKTFQALNYGAYRSACQINNGMADWWGGSGKSKSKDTATTTPGDSDGGHKKSATERAELWAAMVEENVFMRKNPHYDPSCPMDPTTGDYVNAGDKKKKKKDEFIPDDAASVDIGGSLNAKGKLKAQVFEGEASARGELFAHYDGATIKKSIAKAKAKSGSSSDIGLAKGGSSESEAKERRKAIKPKTGGGLTIETKLGCTILGQAIEFAVKGEIGTQGWGVEIGAGLKFDNAQPTDFAKIANGIVSSGASGLRTLIGIYQNTQQSGGEQASKGIGSLLDAGSDAENIIDTATGGMLTTALGKAYQVNAGQSDQVNETTSKAFDDVTGQNNDLSANQETRAGTGSEVMLQVLIQIGPGTCNIQIKQIKVRKLAVDLGSTALEVSIEKQKKLAQLGMVDGKFHAEGLGFGTTRK